MVKSEKEEIDKRTMSASTESMSKFRVTSIDFQTMLEECLTSATIQNGGEGYIADTLKETQPKGHVIDAFDQIPDLLSSIIDAVGIQQDEELDDEEANTTSDPREKKHKECPMEPAREDFTPQLRQKRQMTINDDGDIEFILPPAPAQMEPQSQQIQLQPTGTPINQQRIEIQNIEILSSKKYFPPATIRDENSDQQIDASNFVFSTNIELQPQLATVDEQPIMDLSPTFIPETFQLLSQGLNTHQQQLERQPATEEFIAQLQQNKQITITEYGDIELVLPPPTEPHQHPDQQTRILVTQTEQQPLSSKANEQPVTHVTSFPEKIQLRPQGLTKPPSQSTPNIPQQATGQVIPSPSIPEVDPSTDIEDHILPKFMITTVLAGSAIIKPAPHIQEQHIVHIPAKRSNQRPASKRAENLDPSRPFQCTEDGCIKSFTRKEHLLRHLSAHSGERMFTCDLCLKLFTRKDNLKKHKRYHLNIAGAALTDESDDVSAVNILEVSQQQQKEELDPKSQNTNTTTDQREYKLKECPKEPQPQQRKQPATEEFIAQPQENRQKTITDDGDSKLDLPLALVQMEPQQEQIQRQHPGQKTTVPLSTLTPINQQHIEIVDVQMLLPNKCFPPATLSDDNNDQQIVAHIDESKVLATNHPSKTELQTQSTDVAEQQITHTIPETSQLASQGLTKQKLHQLKQLQQPQQELQPATEEFIAQPQQSKHRTITEDGHNEHPPPTQMDPAEQSPISLPTEKPIIQQHIGMLDFQMLPPKKRFLAITLRGYNSNQPIVTHIDVTKCVVSTTTEVSNENQPVGVLTASRSAAPVDKQPINHIPPDCFLEALQLTPKRLNKQQQQQNE